MKTTPNRNRGFSTIELLIAFAVGIIMISAAMMIAFGGQSIGLDAMLDSHGLSRAMTQIGDASRKIAENWNANPTPDADLHADNYVDSFGNPLYTRKNSVDDISPCTKTVTSNTTWDKSTNRPDADTLFGTIFSNIDIAKALGPGGCDPIPPGDWDNPDTFGTFDPIGITSNGIQATAIETKSIGNVRYAFMTSQHGTRDEPDFWILDVHNPQNPTYVKSIDINNGVAWGGAHKEGANDLVVVGNYAYVLRNYKKDQLQVIDISNLNNPVQVTPAISFEPRGVLQTGSDPQGEVIKYYNGRLYIGLHTTIGPELLVYDIVSNPAIPVFIGAVPVGFDHSIYDIVPNGNYAYVAVKPGSGQFPVKELMVLDISGSNPSDTGNGFNATNVGGAGAVIEGATALYMLGNKLYMGMERVNNAAESDFYVLDITNPAVSTLSGHKNLNLASGAEIKSLYVSGDLAFMGNTKNKEFQIWDVSNLSNIHLFACGGFDFPQEISDITYADDLIFASIRSNDFFRVIHDETSDLLCN